MELLRNEEIAHLINELRIAWHFNQELRLGQLLENITTCPKNPGVVKGQKLKCIFHIPDKELIEKLREFNKEKFDATRLRNPNSTGS